MDPTEKGKNTPPLDYGTRPPARSQWITDDQPRTGCFFASLLVGNAILAVIAAIGAIAWFLVSGC